MANIEKESLLTQEYLKEIFDYQDGFLYWKIKTNVTNIGDRAGYINKLKTCDRRSVGVKGEVYGAHRLIFLYHKGYIPEEIDHIDRNSLNDKIENLRPASSAENQRNRRSRLNSTSKYLGVYKRTNASWVATIYVKQISKNKHLGTFHNEHKAAEAYNAAAKIHHGEFANLNIIEDQTSSSIING